MANTFNVGDNFLGRNGQRMVLTNIKTIGDQSLYELIHESGKKQTYSIADMRGLEQYKGKKKISAKTATKYADKWDELGTKMSEYYKKARENPAWSYEDKIKFFENEIDPLTKSLNGYKANISKTVGHTVDFDPAKVYSLEDFNKERKRAQDKILEKQRAEAERQKNRYEQSTSNNNSTPVNRNLEAGDVVDINTGDIKKADGTIIKKDGTIIRPNVNSHNNTSSANLDDLKNSTQKFFESKNVSNQDIVDNFDKYFTQAMDGVDFSKINGEDLIAYRGELKKQYETRLNNEIEARSEESKKRRQQEIENKKKNSKPSDDTYWNGQQKKTVQHLEDGVVAEFYHGENGEVLVQKLLYPDGKRDISVRRTKEDLAKFSPEELDGAQHQISKKRVIREGDNISISKNPDSMYVEETKVDLATGEVERKQTLRDRPWGGGKQDEKITTSKLKKNMSELDDEFFANLTDDQILDQAQTNEELERYIKMRDDARARLGMDSQTFNIETENKTINNNFNGVNQEHQQQTKNTTEETIEAEFDQEVERIEKESGSAKHDLDDASLHLDSPDVKTRKQRLEKAGKRLSNNKGPNGTKKRFTGQRVANNSRRSIKKRKLSGKKFKVKGGNLKQAAANTFVNIATETVRETIAKNADELKNFGRHPNLFKFDEFADLTDADIDFYYDNLFGIDTKTKQQMKKTWIEKRKLAKTARDSAKKRKIVENFDDYMDNFFSYNGYSSIEGQARFNPDPEIGWDEVDFRNPDSYNRHRIDFETDDDGNIKFKRYDEMETIEIEQNRPRRVKGGAADDDIFGWMKKHKIGLGEAINVLSTISTYKDARKQGHSVGSSMVRAAGSFVMGEMLGFWGSLGWELAKGIPKAAIKGAEVLYKENRKMNAAANQYGLGGNFQDTQQLATMRQSGMEMAKMAQYNLQQTLMGNEATHLHR